MTRIREKNYIFYIECKDRRYFKFPDLNQFKISPAREENIECIDSYEVRAPPSLSIQDYPANGGYQGDGILCKRNSGSCVIHLLSSAASRSRKKIDEAGDERGHFGEHCSGECLLPPAVEQWKCKF